MNNKIKKTEVPKTLQKQVQRRPKRCHLCKKSFPSDKYNEHFQTCYRFGENSPQVEKKPELVRPAEKNRVANGPAVKKEEKEMRGREGGEGGGRFRIKNVSNLAQTTKAQAPVSQQTEEERINVSSNPNGSDFQRQQERRVSIDVRSEQESNNSQGREPERPITTRMAENRQVENPEECQNSANLGEASSSLPQREASPPAVRPHISQNAQRTTNQPRLEEPIVVVPPPERAPTVAAAPPQNQPYDMQALMENANSIIAFIRTMNANGEDESLNLMIGQLEQLNRIAEQIAQLNQIGRSLSMGNVFAARIHEVQSTIVNQIGIALIRGFNSRLGSDFEAIAQRQPEIKVGFTQREMDAMFPEKLSTEQQECSICLEEIPPADLVVELQCFHVFHPSCITEWLRGSKKCPMCRTVQQPAAVR